MILRKFPFSILKDSMNSSSSLSELNSLIAKASRPLVLVPTMGALHDGHCSLIREARKIAGTQGTVAVSIFVNPIQFDRKEDLKNYPITIDSDLAAAKASGADLVFMPATEEIYHQNRSTSVIESKLSQHLCGATRPGHFDGVCTVVLKLFLIFQANYAVFGKKDYQQLAVIRRMVRDLNIPITIVGVETVREPDGLALSSRNTRLDPQDRKNAAAIRKGLLHAKNLFAEKEYAPEALIAGAKKIIEHSFPAKIDYLTLVDAGNLEIIDSPIQPKQKALLACAVFYGKVRLIDNIELN